MQIGSIATPLVVAEWEAALTTHPDQVYVQYLLRGLRNGFRIGFDRAHRLRSVQKNMQSMRDNPEVVSQYPVPCGGSGSRPSVQMRLGQALVGMSAASVSSPSPTSLISGV